MTNDRDVLNAAQERIRDAFLPCQQFPNMNTEDIKVVRGAAWQRIQELGAPTDAPGDRLYILSFMGPVAYIKPGRTTNLLQRIHRHEKDALVHRAFLFDAWVSRPYPNARRWEEKTLISLRCLPGVVSVGEHFYDLDFETAVKIAQDERSVL